MAKLAIPFGNPTTYAGHSGVDFPVPRGTPFPASGPGRVTWLGWNAVGGYFIWVKYDAITPEVGYHHMDSHNGCPAVGSRVNEGTRLGYVGSSGRSTGPHLHSEVAGHRTTDGYWRFFDRNRVVGSGTASGGSTTPAPTPTPESEEDDMYIANVKNGNFYLVIGTKAHALGAASGARESGIPIINYVDDWAVARLKTVVSGIA